MDPKTLPESGYNRVYKGPVKVLAGLRCRLIGTFPAWGPFCYVVEFAGFKNARRIMKLKHVPRATKANKGVKHEAD